QKNTTAQNTLNILMIVFATGTKSALNEKNLASNAKIKTKKNDKIVAQILPFKISLTALILIFSYIKKTSEYLNIFKGFFSYYISYSSVFSATSVS
ncbi:MAG: hypothetical protein IKA90_01830, partial [Clostridia bacterium]|nr:hypothetical protein [Clostridia bacterium]